jgi:hypothetical protein
MSQLIIKVDALPKFDISPDPGAYTHSLVKHFLNLATGPSLRPHFDILTSVKAEALLQQTKAGHPLKQISSLPETNGDGTHTNVQGYASKLCNKAFQKNW